MCSVCTKGGIVDTIAGWVTSKVQSVLDVFSSLDEKQVKDDVRAFDEWQQQRKRDEF